MRRELGERMKTWRRWGRLGWLPLLALAGALAGGAWAQTLHFAIAEPPPQVEPSGALTVVVLIRNLGEHARTVTLDPELPRGWVVAGALPSVSIPAGAQRAYPLVLHAVERGHGGRFEATLRFRDSIGLPVGVLPLRVEVPTRVELQADWLHAPSQQVTETLRLSLEVRNAGNVRELVHIRGDAGARVDPERFPLDAGAKRTVQVWIPAAPTPREAQPQRVTLHVAGDHGGAATLAHTFTRVPTLLDASRLWHTIPLVLRFGASAQGLAAGAGANVLRFGLAGGATLRDSDRLSFTLDVEPLTRDTRVLLTYEQPTYSARVGHGRIGLHPALSAGEGFGVLLTGRHRIDDALTLAWAGFGQASAAVASATEGRFGVRLTGDIGSGADPRVRAELVLQRQPTYGEAQGTLRFQATPAPRLHFSVDLGAGFDTRGESTQARISGAWRVHHPILRASADGSFTPAGFAGEPRARSDLRFGLVLHLTEALALDANVIGRFDLQVDARRARSVVADTDAGASMADPGAVGGRYAALDRFGVELRAAGGALAGSVGFLRSAEVREADREQILEHRLDASVAMRIGDRITLTPRVGWRARDIVDPLTGWVEQGEEWRLGFATGVALGDGDAAASTSGRFRVGLHADVIFRNGAWTPQGGATLRAPLALAEGGSLDLRTALAMTDAGLRTDLSARTDLDLGGGTTLTLEAGTRFGADAPTVGNASLSVQQRFALPTHKRADLGSVRGTLLRSDGTPLPHVVVRVAGEWLATGSDGSFTFPAVPVGSHAVDVVAETLPAGLLLSPPGPQVVTVHPGGVSELAWLVLAPGGVSVRVHYAPPETASHSGGRVWIGTGDPRVDATFVAGLAVTLVRAESVWRASTDSDGWAHFRDLVPGTYRVEVVGVKLPNTLRLGAIPGTTQVTEGTTTTLTVPLLPLERPIALDAGAGGRAP
jgi:hypothetical protein